MSFVCGDCGLVFDTQVALTFHLTTHLAEAEPMDDDQLRAYAVSVMFNHNPANQPDNGYERCALCHYTRHPCETYDMAEAVVMLIDRGTLLEKGAQ